MFNRHVSALLPTTAFVLLWSSGAIVSEIGLRHGSAFALLILRYSLALAVLVAVAIYNRKLVPERGSRWRVAFIGFSIAGAYSVCYLLAMEHGVTPGALATILGVQPIITVLLTERKAGALRMLGLLLALCGLATVVGDGLVTSRFEPLGLVFALLALLGITFGSIAQKRETQAPWMVLPMQYAVGLSLACSVAPFAGVEATWNAPFVLSGIWLGLVISVATTFLLYRLIARGNLVNVTSLFYLVPGVTALMDWVLLGNPMSHWAIGGLILIMLGLAVAFRSKTA
jgi:drug/metabolite transporter (DMT)-like permease